MLSFKIFKDLLLDEDYKTTAVKFITSGIDKAQVDDYIKKFKELSNKQKLIGDEKNIDNWAKKTFLDFKEFVDAKEKEVAAVANKKVEKKDQGTSFNITTPEQRSAGWNIIIPLDKRASVFYGNLDCMSDWCVAKPQHDYFNEYFYEKNSNLIFCLNDKKKKEKWAIEIKAPSLKYGDRIILYDINDNEITESEFEKQTKLNFDVILRSYKPKIEEIKAFKKPYFDKINLAKLAELKPKFPDATLETWHTHPNGGGWVQNTAKVADTAFVGPDAIVSGNAEVSDKAVVGGSSHVYGNAKIFGDALVSGDARVYENAQVSGKAEVYGTAMVSGKAVVFENTKVYGSSNVYGSSRVYGNTWVYSNVEVYENAKVYGNTEVSGRSRVFGDAEVYENAKVFGDAGVYGNAKVFGSSIVSGESRVFGNAKVSGIAEVSGKSQVFGNAVLFGNARVYQNAKVFGDAQIFRYTVVAGNTEVSGNEIVEKK